MPRAARRSLDDRRTGDVPDEPRSDQSTYRRRWSVPVRETAVSLRDCFLTAEAGQRRATVRNRFQLITREYQTTGQRR